MQNFSHFHPTLAGPFSDQAGPSGILSNRPDSPASVVTDSDSPTSSISSEGLQETQKKHYDKWPQEEQRALVSLWAERHELLESKDARKVWEEIARELNRKFGTICKAQHELYVNAAVFLEKRHSGFACIHLHISDTG